MSIVETLLVFAGIPLAVYLVFTVGVYLPHAVRARRYRPGEPWEFEPLWFAPQTELLDDDTRSLVAVAHGNPQRQAIEGRAAPVARGGARGNW